MIIFSLQWDLGLKVGWQWVEVLSKKVYGFIPGQKKNRWCVVVISSRNHRSEWTGYSPRNFHRRICVAFPPVENRENVEEYPSGFFRGKIPGFYPVYFSPVNHRTFAHWVRSLCASVSFLQILQEYADKVLSFVKFKIEVWTHSDNLIGRIKNGFSDSK